MADRYYSSSIKVSIFGIIVNVILGFAKLIIGIASNSIAIIADAFHSFSDLITTLVVIISLIFSRRPPDKRHPFGYGRAEDIGGLLVSIILILTGLGFFRSSLIRLSNPQRLDITKTVIVFIFITAVVKLFLGIFTSVFSKKLNSAILHTDAAHHYSDFFTSAVISLGLIFIRKGNLSLDAYMGIFIASVIIFWALKLTKEFIDNIIGKEAPHELYKNIKDVIFSFPHVEGVHEINIHSYGHKRIISLHVVVRKDLSLNRAHAVADSIEKKILKDGLGECVVHIDVGEFSSIARRSDVEKVIGRIIRKVSSLKGFHNIEVITTETDSMLNFHLMLDENISLKDSHRIYHRVSKFLKKRFGFSQVNIHIEPYTD